MKRTKFTVKLRNKIASMTCEFDSAACIEDRGMTNEEREYYKEKFRKILKEIDDSILNSDK